MSKPKGFRIAARALRQLGAELITSDEIALNELIKNALDAKSERVLVNVQNPFKVSRKELLKDLTSSDEPLTEGEISTVVKNAFLDEYSDSPECKELTNKLQNSAPKSFAHLVNEYFDQVCSILIEDTGVGMKADKLQDSFLVIGTPSKWVEKQSDSDSELLGEKGVGRLSMMRLGRYAVVNSSVKNEARSNKIQFDWRAFDDPELYLEDIEVPVKPGAPKTPKQSGTSILITGVYAHWNANKLEQFINTYIRRLQNPFSKKSRFPIDIYLNGERQPIERIYPWFKKAANFSASVTLSAGENEPMELRRELTWRGKTSPEIRLWDEEDLMRVLGDEKKNKRLDKSLLRELGTLRLDLLWFNRSDLKGASIDHSPAQIKEELNIWCGGYAIYRDNFRIGMTGSLEDDWLQADKGSLKSQGFAFNRYQTVGSLSITQRHNPNLRDSANREKLINCEQLELLKHLLTKVVNKDLKSHIEFFKENESKKASTEAAAEESLDDARKRLKRAQTSASKLKKNLPKEQQEIISEIEHTLKTQHENIRKYEHAMKLSKEQRIEVLELAGLGMVVDKVVHELARLTEQTTDNLRKLESNNSSEDTSNIIAVIREQIRVTNKRIRTVDSLSPSGRNRKDRFDLTKVVQTVAEGFSGRFSRHAVNLYITVDDSVELKEFEVNMVLGLIALVLENLITNSIYWLKQGLKAGETMRNLSINIDTKAHTLSVRDNGPGIEPSMKEEIFRAYFTNRPDGKGLGLFICQEIADYHQCSIFLDSLIEEDGRNRTFVLELPKK